MSCFPCLNPRPKDVEKNGKPRTEDDINIHSATGDSGLSPGIRMLRAVVIHFNHQIVNLLFYYYCS